MSLMNPTWLNLWHVDTNSGENVLDKVSAPYNEGGGWFEWVSKYHLYTFNYYWYDWLSGVHLPGYDSYRSHALPTKELWHQASPRTTPPLTLTSQVDRIFHLHLTFPWTTSPPDLCQQLAVLEGTWKSRLPSSLFNLYITDSCCP